MHGIMKFLYRFKLIYDKKICEENSIAHYVMSMKYLKKWIKTCKGTKYDLLISISHPFYVHKYAEILINSLRIDKWCAWFLDPYADNYCLSMSKKQVRKRVVEENKIFKNCTSIFATNEMVNQYRNSKIVKYLDKVTIAPTHMITDNCSAYSTETASDNKVKCAFTGAFLPSLRNPKLLFECFKKLPSNYFLYLYSRGCNDIVSQYKNVLSERLITNDYILNKTEFDKMIHNMDILIDIGNTVDNMVPSKILNYLSYGKPILHFTNCENDPAESILQKYPLFLSLSYNESIDVDQIVEFCEKMKGKKISWEEIEKNFYECTLRYVAERVLDILI